MEAKNYEEIVQRNESRGREVDITDPRRIVWGIEDCAEQLAGIHDALIRLEAIFVEMNARGGRAGVREATRSAAI